MIEKFVPADFWADMYVGNALGAYADAALVFLIFASIFYLASVFLLGQFERLAERTETEADDILLRVVRSMRPPFYIFVAFYIAVTTLELPHLVYRSVFVIVVLWCTWQFAQAFGLFVNYLTNRALKGEEGDSHIQSTVGLLAGIAKVGLWIIAGLLILSNFGVNVTSLIAGVGIGGIAIAFAVKGILEDLFSSFSLYLDKPFQVGDMIDVDGEKGTVKKIGIKTTRLKSMTTGEEVIMSNKDMTTKKISNFHRMTKRRVSFDLGVTYETSTEKLKSIPETIEKIISAHEKAEFSRTHFRSFDDSALRFSVLYQYNTRNYAEFLDAHQDILFAIRESFEKDGIDMAYPTRTLHVQSKATNL